MGMLPCVGCPNKEKHITPILVKLLLVSSSILLVEYFDVKVGEGGGGYEIVDLPCCQTCELECRHNRIYLF